MEDDYYLDDSLDAEHDDLKQKVTDLVRALRAGPGILSTSSAPTAPTAPSTTASNPHHVTFAPPRTDVVLTLELDGVDEEDKDELIATLMRENERLKGKINSVLYTAEETLEDTAALHSAQSAEFARQLGNEKRRNVSLAIENEKLKELVVSLRTNLDHERAELGKACASLDKLKKLRLRTRLNYPSSSTLTST